MAEIENDQREDSEQGGIIPVEAVEAGEEIEMISEEDRAAYEADVENVLENDRDLDGDVDAKDKVLKKLDAVENKLRRVGEKGGLVGGAANAVADLIDKVDGSGHRSAS